MRASSRAISWAARFISSRRSLARALALGSKSAMPATWMNSFCACLKRATGSSCPAPASALAVVDVTEHLARDVLAGESRLPAHGEPTMTVRWVKLSFIRWLLSPSVAVLGRRLAGRLPKVGCVRVIGGYRLVHLGDQPFELGLTFRAAVIDLQASARTFWYSFDRPWWVHNVLISRPHAILIPRSTRRCSCSVMALAPLTEVRRRRSKDLGDQAFDSNPPSG